MPFWITPEQFAAVEQAARQGRLFDYLASLDDLAFRNALVGAWMARIDVLRRKRAGTLE